MTVIASIRRRLGAFKKELRSLYRYLRGPAITEGKYGTWYSQGVAQWDKPRRVVHVEFYSDTWYAWCDGSLTAVPASEIVPERA